jgi:hypothetical protein
MKADELMIGNWIEIQRGLKKYPPSQCDIHDLIEMQDNHTKQAIGLTHCNKSRYKFNPIPLTEEWLLRFGFKCIDVINGGYTIQINYPHQKEYLYCSTDGIVALYSESKNQDFIIRGRCEFVHQLQNLYFALTQKELEI